MTYFDRVDTGTPFCDFSREFHVLVSAVTGSERTLAPEVDLVLEVVRMAVNAQFPSLMSTLYPGSMATDPKPCASLDKMWKAFGDLSNNKTGAVNSEKVFPCLFIRRECGHPPRTSAVSDAFMADGVEQ